MVKAIIEEEYSTAMGKVVRVKNDRLFHVGEMIELDNGICRIDRIVFPSHPNDENSIYLIITNH